MTRPAVVLLLWFGVAIGLTQIAGAMLEASRTTQPTNADAAKALEVGPRTVDVSCDGCSRP